MGQSKLLAAFDRALGEVDRVLGATSPAAPGEKLQKQLVRLRNDLVTERMVVSSRGALDPAWAGALVRRTAEWLPDDHLNLLAALGAIVRAGSISAI